MAKHLFTSLLLALSAVLVVAFTPAQAKEAVPVATDPALEARVMALSAELRCLVCQNQTIADSHAELAIDLKNAGVRAEYNEGKFTSATYTNGVFTSQTPVFGDAMWVDAWPEPTDLPARDLYVGDGVAAPVVRHLAERLLEPALFDRRILAAE